MSSLARKQRRGTVDMFGNKLPKRMFNNSKRTKGRKQQSEMEFHTLQLNKRIKYIIKLANEIKKDGYKLNNSNVIEVTRKYDKESFFDNYEQAILIKITNDE